MSDVPTFHDFKFCWNGDALGQRERLGRVYFDGFTICNKHCEGTFAVGDKIRCRHIHEHRGKIVEYVITAVFQATKSWYGDWDGGFRDIQEKGKNFYDQM